MRGARTLLLIERGGELLLRLLPNPVRDRWAGEIGATFQDACRAAHARRGLRGLLMEAPKELADMAATGVKSRLGRGPAVTVPGPTPPRQKRPSSVATLVHDIRLAVRSLGASPLTTAIAFLTLALGIGITTAAFSVLDAVVFRSLPFPHADRLVEIWNVSGSSMPGPPGSLGQQQFSYPRFPRALLLEWRKQTDLFDAVEGYDVESVIWKGPAGAEMVSAAYVTPGVFSLLGAVPLDGRIFVEGDGRDGTDRHIVVSERFWRESLWSSPDAVGSTLTVNGEPHTLVGIMPARFRFPNEPQVMWLPIDVDRPPAAKMQQTLSLEAFARARAGITPEQLAEQVKTRGAALVKATGGRAGVSAQVHDKGSFVDRQDRRALLVLGGSVAFLLLIVCANVANLSLSRLLARARDLAVRSALGAARRDLVRETFIEHAVLGLGGALLGVLVAYATLSIAVATLPSSMLLMSLNEIDLDGRALLFTIGIGVLTSLLFGIPPALIAARPSVTAILRNDSRATSGSPAARRLRSALVVAEVTVALVLLVGAALMARSFIKLQAVDRGFDTSSLVALRVGLPAVGYLDPHARDRFTDELIDAVRRQPGVRGATAGSVPPDASMISFGAIEIAGQASRSDKELIVPVHSAWPNYFETVGIPIKEGRGFTVQEPASSTIVSESFARAYWPDRSPIGAQFRFTGSKLWKTVVGVAGEVRQMDLDDAHGAFEWYRPLRVPPGAPAPVHTATENIVDYRTFVISADDPAAIVGRSREIVHTLDPNVVIWEVDEVDHLFAEAVGRPRVVLTMMAVLAGLGVVLAAAGIYGVLAYLVAQRRREIGIRLALGARPQAIGRLVLRSGLVLTCTGLIAGVAVSLALARVMQALLYEVETTDPVSMALVSTVLLAVALIAAWRPARQAMRTDPLSLLREQ
jgi:predicted permease